MKSPWEKGALLASLYYDLFDHICSVLRTGGFSRVKPLFHRSKQTADVYGQEGVIAVIHGPYRVTAKPQGDLFTDQNLSPQGVQAEFESHLKKVMQLDEGLATALRPRRIVLIFQSGGTLVLPDWFEDWTESKCIRIIIIANENVVALKSLF